MSFEEGSLQKWCATGVVDFLELFCGKGVLTLVVSETGLRTGEGIDGRWTSYGCIWDLKKASTQMRLAWLVAYGIQPLAIHSGTPCTEFTVIGPQEIRDGTEGMAVAVAELLEHQEAQGYLGSNEQPDRTELYELTLWVSRFGARDAPGPKRWQYYKADGCQLGVVSPDRDALGQPHQKSQAWMANFGMGPFALRCQATPALVPASHEHQHVRGKCPGADGRWLSLATESGAYVVPQAALYARCMQRALQQVKRNRAVKKSPLTARLPEAVHGTRPVERDTDSSEEEGTGLPDHRPGDPARVVEEHVCRFGRLERLDAHAGRVLAQASGPEDRAAPKQPAPGAAAGSPNLEWSEDPAVVARREQQLRLAGAKAKELWKHRAQTKKWEDIQASITVYLSS